MTTRRELKFYERYEWAYEVYRAALRSGDYSPFAVGGRLRIKIARLWVDLRDLANPSRGEQLLIVPTETLWFELTRPSWDNF